MKLDLGIVCSLQKAPQGSHSLAEKPTLADMDQQGRVGTSATDQMPLVCEAHLKPGHVRRHSQGGSPGPDQWPSPPPAPPPLLCLGESHLLWDYPDFCLGGRRGLSACMPFSPGGVRRRDYSLSHPRMVRKTLLK